MSLCLKSNMEGYEFVKDLGEGTFGRVALYRDRDNDSLVAIKSISNDHDNIQREVVNHWMVSDHPNITVMKKMFMTEKKCCIVLEYVENGDMFAYLTRMGPLGESNARFYIYQILLALSYCHKKNIVHCDIKMENILLDKNMRPKLTDFGYSRFLDEPLQRVGTLQYLPPEVIDMKPSDQTKIDVYSAGVLLYIMLHSTYPFYEPNNIEVVKKIRSNDYKITRDGLTLECVDLIQRMLDPDYNTRISIDDIMKHPWMLEDRFLDSWISYLEFTV